jgi:predicted nucleic acid-binding protein
VVVLDSVILIDHFNGRLEATAYLKKASGSCVISVITRAEVLAGFRDSIALERAIRLLDIFAVLDITKPIADLAAQLRRDHRWKLPDALQAAVALSHGMKLVTRNTKDFPASLDFVELPYV